MNECHSYFISMIHISIRILNSFFHVIPQSRNIVMNDRLQSSSIIPIKILSYKPQINFVPIFFCVVFIFRENNNTVAMKIIFLENERRFQFLYRYLLRHIFNCTSHKSRTLNNRNLI